MYMVCIHAEKQRIWAIHHLSHTCMKHQKANIQNYLHRHVFFVWCVCVCLRVCGARPFSILAIHGLSIPKGIYSYSDRTGKCGMYCVCAIMCVRACAYGSSRNVVCVCAIMCVRACAYGSSRNDVCVRRFMHIT